MVVILNSAICGNGFTASAGTPLECSEGKAKRLIEAGLAREPDSYVDAEKVVNLPADPKPAKPIKQLPKPIGVDDGDGVEVFVSELKQFGLDPKIQSKLDDGLAELSDEERPTTAEELAIWARENDGLESLKFIGKVSAKPIVEVLKELGCEI